jgi:N-acetylneuraminic acid mutarotase
MDLKKLILFLLVCLLACERYESQGEGLVCADSWDVDFGLASGSCVVHDDTLYVLFGREEGGSAEEPSGVWRRAWMGDLSDWDEMELPLAPRVSGTAIVVGGKLYAGLGFCGRVYQGSPRLRDWWEYDFDSCRWLRLADFPTEDVVSPVVWNDGDFIYTVFGYNVASSGKVYRYDIKGDRWEIYSEESAPWARADALSGVVGDVLYCGGGSSSYMKEDWWCYDWRRNEWEECCKLPAARVFASSVTIGSDIYVLGGRYFGGTETREHFFETIVVYDVEEDEWRTVGRMEQAAENMIAWEYDGDLYWGLGQRGDGEFVQKIYRKDMRIEN